jgi:hypothetical protein
VISLAQYIVELSQNPARAQRVREGLEDIGNAGLSPEDVDVLRTNDAEKIADAISGELKLDHAGALNLVRTASIIHP